MPRTSSPTTTWTTVPRAAAAALVFTTSAIVLVLEILAGRLLAPYVGVTLETFTGIIGTVLAGIALGAWAGGRLADRRDPRGMIGQAIAVGGILTFVSVPVVDFLGAGMQGAGPPVIVLLSFMGFFAPAAVLSTVSPMVVKLQLRDLGETGEVVGRLSALGTAGAILGTFASGFLLVAAAPTRPSIRVIGVVLVLGGIALAAWLRPDERPGGGTVAAAIAAGMLSLVSPGPCEFESAYFCGRVEVDPENPSGRILVLDTLRHSYVDLDDPTNLSFSYAQTMSDVLEHVAPPTDPLEVVHVGGAGLSLPRYLAATRPGTRSTVLEIDELLVEVAQEELGAVLDDDLQVRIGDARLTLADVPEGSVDLVIGDAFGGVSVPWHLTTREFVELVRSRLRPGGTYALNMIDYGPLGFARAEAATLAAVFEHVAVFAPLDRLSGEAGGNFVMVASDAPIDVAAILTRNAFRGDDESAITTVGPSPDPAAPAFADFVGAAEVLRDDHAPVDTLITPLPTARRTG